jgi:hypothetical protein
MKIVILVSGLYSDYSNLHKITAQRLEAGTEITFPDDYAGRLITAGLARMVDERVIFDQNLADEMPLVEQMDKTLKQRVHPEPVERVHPEPVERVHPEPVERVHPEPVERVHPEPVERVHPELDRRGRKRG